ncbi:MAG: sulfite exporter TauE/SafE family protein [Gammaproteobacteria bacterium]|nr:sulfite exporter TauE/SafE family protein [Gammaproteobacteria bacterium]
MSLIESIGTAQLLYMALVLLLAYIIKGVAGFGSGLLAVPLLTLVAPLTLVVPLLGLISYTGTLIQAYQYRRNVVWRDCLRVLPFSVLGVMLAIWLFQQLDLYWLNKALALFVISYALISLRAESSAMTNPLWAAPAGFFAGLVGALFGTGGPFYVAYLRLRRLNKSAFRATIVFIFMFDGAIRISAYSISGFYAADVLTMAVAGIPVLLVGLYLGHRIHLRISKQRFNQIISLILLGSGLVLFFK